MSGLRATPARLVLHQAQSHTSAMTIHTASLTHKASGHPLQSWVSHALLRYPWDQCLEATNHVPAASPCDSSTVTGTSTLLVQTHQYERAGYSHTHNRAILRQWAVNPAAHEFCPNWGLQTSSWEVLLPSPASSASIMRYNRAHTYSHANQSSQANQSCLAPS